MRTAACCAFLLVAVFWGAAGKELVWRYDSDIGNADNWLGGRLGADCRGLHFAAVNSAPVFIRELVTAEVTLPTDGEIFIEADGFVEFKDNGKCINLKPIDYHDWYDPDSWRLKSTNVAIPDKEKIPCRDDDVTFPKSQHVPIAFSMFGTPRVASIKIDKEVLTGEEQVYYQFDTHSEKNNVEVHREKCQDPYGCLCHKTNIFCPMDNHQDVKKLPCQNPVTPEDFCREICGAYITYKPGDGPNLAQVARKLKEFDEIDVHVSRVKNYLGSEVIQVVFSEKEYTGTSLDRADDFLDFLRSSRAENAQLFKSGQFYMDGGSSWSIIFGTFAAVVAFFAVLLYLHGDQNVTTIISRLQRTRGSIFAAPFFARFDNTDEHLIIDGQSESGSILDIAKSFDNPMYGQSTSEPLQEDKAQGTTFDNPMFALKEAREDGSEAEEAEEDDKKEEESGNLYEAPLLVVTQDEESEE